MIEAVGYWICSNSLNQSNLTPPSSFTMLYHITGTNVTMHSGRVILPLSQNHKTRPELPIAMDICFMDVQDAFGVTLTAEVWCFGTYRPHLGKHYSGIAWWLHVGIFGPVIVSVYKTSAPSAWVSNCRTFQETVGVNDYKWCGTIDLCIALYFDINQIGIVNNNSGWRVFQKSWCEWTPLICPHWP